MFDAVTYFEQLKKSLKETATGFGYTQISGLENLEGIMADLKREKNFIAVDDTADGTMVNKNGGYFERRPYFVFAIKNFSQGDMDQRQTRLEECRVIFRKFLSRMIRDKHRLLDNLIFLELDEVVFHELPGYFAAGATGLYFGFYVDIPQDLSYKDDDWQ